MLTVTIKDNEGGERTLTFDQEEIILGRFENNDIVLPRNNISKKHAAILDTDGKIVVRDLRSTNGTYVNQRRITAPQELGESDLIYIGDFVITCKRGAAEAADSPPPDLPPLPPPMPGPTEDIGAQAAIASEDEGEPPALFDEEPEEAGAEEAGAEEEVEEATMALTAEQIAALDEEPAEDISDTETAADPADEEPEEPEEATMALTAEQIAALDEEPAEADDASSASEEPVEEEEREEATMAMDAVDEELIEAAMAATAPEAIPDEQTEEIDDEIIDEVAEQIRAEEDAAESDTSAETPDDSEADEPSQADTETQEMDLALDQTEAADAESASEDDDQELPEEPEASTDDASDESAPEALPAAIEEGLGVVTNILQDPQVHTIHISRCDRIIAERGNDREATGFSLGTTEDLTQLADTIAEKLGLESSGGGISFSGTFDSGLHVHVIGSDLATDGPVIVVRRPVARHATIEQVAQASGLDEQALTALTEAIASRKNILICGRPGSGRSSVANALTRLIPTHDRIALIERVPQLAVPHTHVVRLDRDNVLAAGSLSDLLTAVGADRVVLDDLVGGDAFELFQLALTGQDGLIAVVQGTSAEDLLARLPLELQFTGGAELGADVRAIVAATVDIILEVGAEHGTIGQAIIIESSNDAGFDTRSLLS